MSDDPDQAISASALILYRTDDAQTRIEVQLEGGTVWLTQAQMAALFQTTPQNIALHLKAIFEEGELQEGQRRVSRALRHYNLEAILAVGYQIQATS